jgi:hypothetical protein
MLFILTGLTLQRGQSALYCASSAGETECVKVLLKYGAQMDLPVRYDVNGSRVEELCLGKLGNWFDWGGRCLTRSGRGWYRPLLVQLCLNF